MPSLQPLVDKLAQQADAAHLILVFVCIWFAFLAYMRERQLRRCHDKLSTIAEQTAKAGYASAESDRVSTEEARKQRETLQTMASTSTQEAQKQREVLQRLASTVNVLIRELKKRGVP